VVGYREKSERIAALVSADPDIDDLPLWQELWQEYADHLDSLAGFFGPSLLELARFSVDDGFPTSLNLHEGVLELQLCVGDLQRGYFDLELRYLGVEISPDVDQALRDWLLQREDANCHLFDRTEHGAIRYELLYHAHPGSIVILAQGIEWTLLPRGEREPRKRGVAGAEGG